MIPRIALAALLHALNAAAVCTKLEDCAQFEKLKTHECQPYHHFLARGSTSPYPGHLIETVGKVCDQLNNNTHPNACGYEDVEYWAMNGGERWCKSAHEGAMNGAEQMRNYTTRCPDSHLIVMGFSQGGSVQLDVLGGGGGEMWGCNQQTNPAMDISSGPGAKGRHTPLVLSSRDGTWMLTNTIQSQLLLYLEQHDAAQTRTSHTVAVKFPTAVHPEPQSRTRAFSLTPTPTNSANTASLTILYVRHTPRTRT
jgi:hypothetical protein